MQVSEFVFLYLRLSDEDNLKSDESNSIKNQRLLLHGFVKQNPEFSKNKIKEFVDDGYTGTNFNRPGFQNMIKEIMAESTASITVLVKDFSRLGRDTIDTQDYIEKVFPFLGTRLIAINEDFDSKTAVGSGCDTEVKFKNLINGVYPQICSQNIKAVFRQKAMQGLFLGGRPPYGYYFNEDRNKLLVDKEAAQIVRFIFKRWFKDKNYTRIARELNTMEIEPPMLYLNRKHGRTILTRKKGSYIWGKMIIKRILTNPIYTGTMVACKFERKVIAVDVATIKPREEWVYTEGTHEAIIPKHIYEAAQNYIPSTRGYLNPNKRTSVFKGKLKCGHCGKALRIRSEYKEPKFSCSTPFVDTKLGCTKGLFQLKDLENTVLEMVNYQTARVLTQVKSISKMEVNDDLESLQRNISGKQHQLEALSASKLAAYEDYKEGRTTRQEFMDLKDKVTKQENKLEKNIVDYQEQLEQYKNKEKVKNSPYIKSFSKYENPDHLTNEIVDELIQYVYFYDENKIEIVWNFKDDMEALCYSSEGVA